MRTSMTSALRSALRTFVGQLLLCQLIVVGTSQSVPAADAKPSEPMNIVFFLVDDLGWADLGCFGSSFYETPHIDELCASGMKFTHAYAACPVCSPTRASIMTGRHPVRVDITDWIPGRRVRHAKLKHVEDRDHLALSEVTIAEVLNDHGYQTFFAGKWHLGGRAHWPTSQGFDMNIGGCHVGSPPGGYYAPWTNPARSQSRWRVLDRTTDRGIDHVPGATRTGSAFLALPVVLQRPHAHHTL